MNQKSNKKNKTLEKNKNRKRKNKTLKKNKNCKKKNKTLKKNKKGGSIIYDTDTDTVKNSNLTYNGFPFFRKVYINPPKNEEQRYVISIENAIVKILMEHTNPNIVKYYDINNRYVDMEQLNTFKSNPAFFDEPSMTSEEINEIQEVMRHVKDFLQGLGIMYIDWKFDNIGKSSDGKYKLFDFDASGLIDLTTTEWKLKHVEYWSYNQAIKTSSKTPKEIDDWSFNHNIIEEGNKKIQEQIGV